MRFRTLDTRACSGVLGSEALNNIYLILIKDVFFFEFCKSKGYKSTTVALSRPSNRVCLVQGLKFINAVLTVLK